MENKYLISSCTSQTKNNNGIFELLPIMKKAGFDAYDFTMIITPEVTDVFIDKDDYIDRAQKLRDFADNLGMRCNQTHSNFPIEHPSFSSEKKSYEFKLLIRSLEVSSILGAKYCVVHPLNDYDDEYNYKYFKRILPYAHKFGIKIAIENMWNWDDIKNEATLASCSNHRNFVHLLDLINDDYAVGIVDIGHAEMRGLNTNAPKMIRALGSRLACLHIHDNDKHFDQHLLPGEGSINFDEIIDALIDVNYQGDFTMEVLNPIEKLPSDELFYEYKKIHRCGEKLKKQFLCKVIS